jgi:prepilin-type N-terminal cleavage/methylation domain-containing protein
MIQAVHRRLAPDDQSGFTLTELLVVLVIIGVLLSIAVGAYIGLRGRASETAAKSLIHQIVPLMEAYYADNGTYATMTLDQLKSSYDQAIDPARFQLSSLSDTSYCVHSTYGGVAWRKEGPSEPVERGTCS